jgi:hypothetical protein
VLQSTAIASGVKPLTNFVCRVVNRAFRDELGLARVMLRVPTAEAETPETVYQRNVVYAKAGILPWNAVRKAAGEDPYEGEWADRPMLVGTDGTTVVFLDEIEQKLKDDAAAAEAARMAFEDAGSGGTSAAPPIEKPNASETAPPGPAQKALYAHGQRIREDLAKWRRAALNRAKAGKPMKAFESDVIPPALRKRIEEALAVAS